jgi:hypothetical protein
MAMRWLGSAIRLALIVAQLPVALITLYLDSLTVAAALWRRHVTPREPQTRFAVLVPAHDEELVLPRLLASCGALDYPAHLFTVHLVADNCSDGTAEVARNAGVTVHERNDTTLRGKGHALHWLLERLGTAGLAYDAYVIVDADTVVSPNLLRVFDAHLARGDQAIQCYYGVLNADQGRQAMLRYCALALYNGLRPRGRDALGLSAGLRGNGMCFSAPLLERLGWTAYSLAEDAEFHLRLVESGIHVTYAAQAHVVAEMPTSLRQAQSQHMRWERGRLQLLRAHGTRLLVEGVRRRDPARLDALAELALPPFSIVVASVCGWLGLTTISRARGARGLAAWVLLGQVGYVLGGLRIARAPLRAYTALLVAPPLAAWKLLLYLRAALGRDDGRWVRTERKR